MKLLLALSLSFVAVIGATAIQQIQFAGLHPNSAAAVNAVVLMTIFNPYLWLALMLIWGGIYSRGRWW